METQWNVADNSMMPLCPSSYNPYWTGMQAGIDGYAHPYGGPLPYMGYGLGPSDIAFGFLAQDPFGAQGYLMPPGPPQMYASCFVLFLFMLSPFVFCFFVFMNVNKRGKSFFGTDTVSFGLWLREDKVPFICLFMVVYVCLQFSYDGYEHVTDRDRNFQSNNRDLANFGMAFNAGPPIVSREQFEARKADLRRKHEIESRGNR